MLLCFLLFSSILFYFALFYFILFYFLILFYFALFYFTLFFSILFLFPLFYFLSLYLMLCSCPGLGPPLCLRWSNAIFSLREWFLSVSVALTAFFSLKLQTPCKTVSCTPQGRAVLVGCLHSSGIETRFWGSPWKTPTISHCSEDWKGTCALKQTKNPKTN